MRLRRFPAGVACTEADPPNPVNLYGLTKFGGEAAVRAQAQRPTAGVPAMAHGPPIFHRAVPGHGASSRVYWMITPIRRKAEPAVDQFPLAGRTYTR